MTMNRRWTDGALGTALRMAQIVTSLVATIALIITLLHVNDVNVSRRQSAQDACLFLVQLSQAFHVGGLALSLTPTGSPSFVAHSPLYDCKVYGKKVG